MCGLINRRRPHNRLPAEILAHIFSLVSNADSWDGSSYAPAWGVPSQGGQPGELVPLTAVCQRWRSILLETPLLWATIHDSYDVDRAPSFTHYIHRCPRGPLAVYMYKLPHSATQDFLAHHSGRVQDLSILSYRGDGLGFPDSITSFHADELRRCMLHLHDEEYVGPPLQTFFHDGHAPQLRAIVLEFPPYLPRNHFHALTHFILKCSTAFSYSFEDLQAFLSGCPALQVLHMLMASTSSMQAPSTPPPPHSCTQLQHLQKLSVVALTSNTHNIPGQTTGTLPQALLAAIVFPPQCLVYICPLLPSDMHSFADRMSTRIMPSSMRIAGAMPTNSAQSGPGPISFTLIQPSESRGVRYHVTLGSHSEDAQTIKRSIRLTMAASQLFSAIRELWVDTGAIDLLCGTRESILRSLVRLEYLSVGSSSLEIKGLYDVLAVLSAVYVQGDALVCPKLDTLSIIAFVPTNQERLIERVRHALAVRKDLGSPLTHLALSLDFEPEGKALVEARTLVGLVEHFVLNDPEVDLTADIEWERYWEDRVPAGCGATDEIRDHWPVWT